MHCGCPHPGDTIGQRLNRLKRRLLVSRAPEELCPPEHPDAFQGSHPSDHNCVQAHKYLSKQAWNQRLEKAHKRKERDTKKYRKGKLDEKTYRRMEAHDMAFLHPIPFLDPSDGPCVALSEAGACAVVSTFSVRFNASIQRKFPS